jgi:hypothetical protein
MGTPHLDEVDGSQGRTPYLPHKQREMTMLSWHQTSPFTPAITGSFRISPSTTRTSVAVFSISGSDFVLTKGQVTSSFENSLAIPAPFAPYELPHACVIVPPSYNSQWRARCALIYRPALAPTTVSPIYATIPFAIHSSRPASWLTQTNRTTCVGIAPVSHPIASASRPLCACIWRGIVWMQSPSNSVGTRSRSQPTYGTASRQLVLHYKRPFWPVISSSLHALISLTHPFVSQSGTLLPATRLSSCPALRSPLYSSSLDSSDSESKGATP